MATEPTKQHKVMQMEQKTVTAKSAAGMAAMINDAISRNRIPVIVADQPAIAAMIVGQIDGNVSVNSKFSDAEVVKQLHAAAAFRNIERRVGHVVLMKSGKIGAGTFDGRHYVKIISNRLNVTIGSLANFLVGGE